ncbi:MAG TPA: universal stress protein [Streptosporangiaceae bacterium]|nr:universal stress protein [Streptosporangiaceae bacterium]
MAAKPVVAGVDGSPQSVQAVEWAAREAVLRGTTLRLVAVASMPPRMRPNPATPDTVAGHIEQATNQALAAAAGEASDDAPDLPVETRLLDGVAPAQALVDSGKDALMLVLGSRGAGGFSALVLGSVSRYAATHAPCPVVVVREETMAAHREVVVGVQDPAQSAAALSFAFEEAALREARLVAMHAWSRSAFGRHDETPDEEQHALEALLASWREKYPDVTASAEVMHAHPGRVLSGASARADLVVLGRHARGDGSGPGAGSVTHSVLSHAHGPVVSVPGE